MAIDLTKINQGIATELKRAYENEQLSHSYLLIDTDIEEAVNTAYWFTCLYHCQGDNKPCGSCQNCQNILQGNFPDCMLVKPEGKQTIGIDQVRELKNELAKSPVESDRRFFIVQNAEKMTLNAANALLILLEEPASPVVNFLIADNLEQILPTIRSRMQILQANGAINGKIKLDEKLRAQVTAFYHKLAVHDQMALLDASKIGANKANQSQIVDLLKELALKEQNFEILKSLLHLDQQLAYNVNFKAALEYIALSWKG
ncbi:MAG: DNA polymerase III subunit delta [Lactobacillus sp.]|nr:DNA polymerase III subunit delta [Lactobacillus sp.]